MAKASGQVSRRKDIAHADALMAPSAAPEPWRQQREQWNTEAYATIEENRFLAAVDHPVSTFSIDVDAASYSNVRRFLAQGTLPPADAVRARGDGQLLPLSTIPTGAGAHPFGRDRPSVGPCPWAADHRLVRIGAAGPPGRRPGAAAEQSGLPDRRLRLDAVARQAAAGAARLPRAGAAAPPGRPGGHRGLRRRGGARPAVDARDQERGDPGRDRSPGGRRHHGGRRRTPAGLRRGARALPSRRATTASSWPPTATSTSA